MPNEDKCVNHLFYNFAPKGQESGSIYQVRSLPLAGKDVLLEVLGWVIPFPEGKTQV